ncbi:MAG: IS3 family transposase [Candidatus Poribacteria bacterium]
MKRKRFSKELKAKVAVEAIKSQKPVNELAAEFGLHPTQVNTWKKQAIDAPLESFGNNQAKKEPNHEEEKDNLYRQIGKLQVEVDWLKKDQASQLTVSEKRECIEADHPKLSLRRQCELIGLSPASYYRQPAQENDKNLKLIRLMDEEYTKHPFYGSRKLYQHLRNQGFRVNRKRVQRLMRKMDMASIAPKPYTSQPGPGHTV